MGRLIDRQKKETHRHKDGEIEKPKQAEAKRYERDTKTKRGGGGRALEVRSLCVKKNALRPENEL
jgi:hypothetical protein